MRTAPVRDGRDGVGSAWVGTHTGLCLKIQSPGVCPDHGDLLRGFSISFALGALGLGVLDLRTRLVAALLIVAMVWLKLPPESLS